MNSLVAGLGRHGEALARILPFAVYIAFLVAAPTLREALPAGWDGRWLYAVQIAAVILALAFFARAYEELCPLALGWRDALEAVVAGIAVFVLWIILDFSWAMLGAPGAGFDPRTSSGDVDWALVTVRIFGAAAVVPIMEELFWRSFIMRWLDKPDFLQLPAVATSGRALAISAVVFGIEHNLWLAGILAGLAYGGLYMRSGKLWSPILAHAVTNLLLGLWVVATGAWSFW
jgi:CAAX prenyl protease-like protein